MCARKLPFATRQHNRTPIYGHIGRHPAAGSPRYAHELNLPDLRFWLVPGYPCVVFYVECDDHVDVWRVLHAQRDVPSWMVE